MKTFLKAVIGAVLGTAIGLALAQFTPGTVLTAAALNAALAAPTITGGSINAAAIGGSTPSSGAFTTLSTGTLSATGQITSTLATGTAPLSISSTTQVSNLNVSQLEGKTWEIPGAIGSTTPNSGVFSTLSATTSASLPSATTAVTQSASDNSTKVATTAYADNAVAGLSNGISANLLINGDGMVSQRFDPLGGITATNNTFDFDRWVMLSQTGSVAISQQRDVADGTPFMMRTSQSQVTAQRFGRIQAIEGDNIKAFRATGVTLSIKHKISSAGNIRMAILEWTGTKDSIGANKNVVNDWTSGTYTGGNFFVATNITVRAVSSSISSTTSLQTSTLSATLGSTLNNLFVFVWTEGTTAQNVTADWALTLYPSSAASVVRRSYSDELRLAQRYFVKYAWDTDQIGPFGHGAITTATTGLFFVPFPAPMRVAAGTASGGTVTVTNMAQMRMTDATASPTVTSVTVNAGSAPPPSAWVTELLIAATGGGLTTGRVGRITSASGVTLPAISFDAEM